MTVDEKLDEYSTEGSHLESRKKPVEKLVVLKFDGNFQQGFRVLLEIGHESDRPSIELAGSLPPNPELAAQLSQWQQHYHSLSTHGLANSRIQPQQITYGGSVNRIKDCWQSAAELHQQMTAWLSSPSFRSLDLRLRESLSLNEHIRVLIRTLDPLLHRLPWHLWDFIERYSKTEIALSSPVSERIEVASLAVRSHRVKVLAVLGSSKDINVQADRQFLAALPNAEIAFLVEPSRAQITQRLWEQPWDILFFAGHSSTDGDRGLVCINPNENLSLEELKYGLKQAISKGLQLAIFNSCDGLGLARSLESLHLPQMIVMREPVPDRVAHLFLKCFLTAFSSGQSLYLSVREAREQLQSIEDQFPCATWLPIICQNSAKIPPDWRSLIGGEEADETIKDSYINTAIAAPRSSPAVAGMVRTLRHITQECFKLWASYYDEYSRQLPRQVRKLQVVMLVSLMVTAVLISPLLVSKMQPLELETYDRMMQHRPNEGADPRLLIVAITDADIEAQKKNGELLERRSQSAQSFNQVFETSLSDQSLSRLLDKLDQYQPRVVGLDLYRDFAVGANQAALSSRLRNNNALTAICKTEDFNDPAIPSIDPPPEVPLTRVGFSDFREDSDGILRRHLLGMLPLVRTQNSRCNTDWSFSAQIAAQYLRQQQIEFHFTEGGDLWLSNRTVEVLRSRGGSYPPNAGGSEIMLNYRATPEIAPVVTLQQFLTQQTNSDYLTDKIVLVGATAEGEDYWLTPKNPDVGIPGVVVQAHMISQLLSAALDNRPLLTTLSPWQRTGWVLVWATVGGLLTVLQWQRQNLGRFIICLMLGLGIAIAFLYGLCFLSLLRGHWLPFISLIASLFLSSVLMTIYLFGQAKRSANQLLV